MSSRWGGTRKGGLSPLSLLLLLGIFYITTDHPWGYSWIWTVPNLSPNKNEVVLEEDQEQYELLLGIKVSTQRKLLEEQLLYDAGISLVNSLGRLLFSNF